MTTAKIEITIDNIDDLSILRQIIKKSHLKDQLESLINRTLQYKYAVEISELALTQVEATV